MNEIALLLGKGIQVIPRHVIVRVDAGCFKPSVYGFAGKPVVEIGHAEITEGYFRVWKVLGVRFIEAHLILEGRQIHPHPHHVGSDDECGNGGDAPEKIRHHNAITEGGDESISLRDELLGGDQVGKYQDEGEEPEDAELYGKGGKEEVDADSDDRRQALVELVIGMLKRFLKVIAPAMEQAEPFRKRHKPKIVPDGLRDDEEFAPVKQGGLPHVLRVKGFDAVMVGFKATFQQNSDSDKCHNKGYVEFSEEHGNYPCETAWQKEKTADIGCDGRQYQLQIRA